MIEIYSRKEVREIWLDKNRYSLWLKIEIAAAEALSLITSDAADEPRHV